MDQRGFLVYVDSWVQNQVYILEMSGLRDQKKIISHLLGGLGTNLLQAVRQELQTKNQGELRGYKYIPISLLSQM